MFSCSSLRDHLLREPIRRSFWHSWAWLMTQRWRQGLRKFPMLQEGKKANCLDSSPQRGTAFASLKDTFILAKQCSSVLTQITAVNHRSPNIFNQFPTWYLKLAKWNLKPGTNHKTHDRLSGLNFQVYLHRFDWQEGHNDLTTHYSNTGVWCRGLTQSPGPPLLKALPSTPF